MFETRSLKSHEKKLEFLFEKNLKRIENKFNSPASEFDCDQGPE